MSSRCTSPRRRVPSPLAVDRDTPPDRDSAVASLTSSMPWICEYRRGHEGSGEGLQCQLSGAVRHGVVDPSPNLAVGLSALSSEEHHADKIRVGQDSKQSRQVPVLTWPLSAFFAVHPGTKPPPLSSPWFGEAWTSTLIKKQMHCCT